ncbi:hypothetical protein Ddye_022485 [Dipteronia dyeriana]|uniref:Reverse transcriptase domain-containing protein n=1 Tax=Dipteronia dyeriana TaxID=168575 RepID=A0AAD9TRM5_9ROSI|nr:hypothetical protein Ddye_022485 [Dipteronia dyeriana]
MQTLTAPWCVGGDFNVTLELSERVGIGDHSGSMRCFQDFVLQANVVNIPQKGTPFTWSNNRENQTWARLDRFLFSPSILMWFPGLLQQSLSICLSVHNPVMINEEAKRWGPSPFSFVNWWLEEKDMMKEATKGWTECKVSGSKGVVLFSKAKATKIALKRWLKSNKLKVENPKELENKLVLIDTKAQKEGWTDQLRYQRLNLVKELWKAFEARFSEDEVLLALLSCDGNKALGPDGFNINFIKAQWKVIQKDLMNFINEFHKDGSVVKEVNGAFIALIPKVGNPNSIKDYRPICLVSKVLANRLRKVMSSIIGETQMAFLAKRQIVDSLVIAEEIISKWKSEKEGGLVAKLDFEKAYDNVDHMLEGMGFGSRWRGWINECVSSPRLYVLVNGEPMEEFDMEKGLRQGDPISPFLFNIVVEGLNILLQRASNLGMIAGENFEDSNVHVTHLQFADDTIHFLKPKLEYIRNAKRVLRCFELASGLRINFHKSCLVHVGMNREREISVWASAFKCKQASLPISYLEFPLEARPRSKNFWIPLVSKIEKRLSRWKRASV